jgi:hypothetical protein
MRGNVLVRCGERWTETYCRNAARRCPSTPSHQVPSRLSHLTAELYGREDDTLIAWQRACAQAAETRRGQHDEERLRKALQLAHDGAVELHDGFALVAERQRALPGAGRWRLQLPRPRPPWRGVQAPPGGPPAPGRSGPAMGAGGAAYGPAAGSRTAQGVDATHAQRAQPAAGTCGSGVGRARSPDECLRAGAHRRHGSDLHHPWHQR